MDKESAHQRLLQAIDYLKDKGMARKHEDIADLCGIPRPNITAAINGNVRYVTKGNLEKFAKAYSDYIDESWLLTGEGQMAKPDKSMRPHYDAKACAGFMCDVSVAETGTLQPRIPGMKEYDFTIGAHGESMMPLIEDGDLLVCRKSEDSANPPIGKICVIDGKDGIVVKVIAEANEYGLVLHSLNPDPKYHDYPVEYSAINGVAEVVGLVRSF